MSKEIQDAEFEAFATHRIHATWGNHEWHHAGFMSGIEHARRTPGPATAKLREELAKEYRHMKHGLAMSPPGTTGCSPCLQIATIEDFLAEHEPHP